MKSARLPTDRGGELWTLVHDLSVAGHAATGLRPINYLTFFSQSLAGGREGVVFRYAMALEDKLSAVRVFHRELRGAVAQAGQIGAPQSYLRDYGDEQRVVCMLEGLLNAIYSSLELTAKVNSCFHPGRTWKFRKLAKGRPVFSFDGRPWLPRFLDVRSQLTHFGSPLPIVSEGKVVINFTIPSLEVLPQGLQEIQLNEVGAYASELFQMLDDWATEELEGIDLDQEYDVLLESHPGGPLKPGKRAAREVLAGMKPNSVGSGAVSKVIQYINTLEGFSLVAHSERYTHMGALLTDTVLQAGVTYKTVVLPRVTEILKWPDATTTSGFLAVLKADGAEVALRWKGRKAATIVELASLLNQEAVESVDDLREWLQKSENLETLEKIKGIGKKTLDYIQILAGLSTIAVDVHLTRFLALAGVEPNTYDGARQILLGVAAALEVGPAHLDYSIWLFMSAKKKKR